VLLVQLKAMTERYIGRFADNINMADVFKLRSVTAMVVEYFTFCRFSDYKMLQARHIEIVGENMDMLITFPSSKNDQYHNGQSTILTRNGTDFCAVRILKLYFKRFGFRFGQQAGDKSYLHCMIRRTAGGRYGDGRVAASNTKAREELKATLGAMGYNATGVTHKSFKMLGVSEARKAGMTTAEIAAHGRWRTEVMPLRYMHNLLEYKAGIASKIPW
jgi:hypothetical protein